MSLIITQFLLRNLRIYKFNFLIFWDILYFCESNQEWNLRASYLIKEFYK